MMHHNFNMGDDVLYEGKEAVISRLIDPITVEIFGFLGKEFFWFEKPHKNKFLRLLGFKTMVLEEIKVPKRINVSCWNIKNTSTSFIDN